MPSEIPPKASGQLLATQRKGWLQTSPFPFAHCISFPPSLTLTLAPGAALLWIQLLLPQQTKPIWPHLLLLPFSAFLLPQALIWPCAELFKLSKATEQLTWQKIGKCFRPGPGSHSEGGCRRQQLNCSRLPRNCLCNSDPLSLCARSSCNGIVRSYSFSISSEVKKQCIALLAPTLCQS